MRHYCLKTIWVEVWHHFPSRPRWFTWREANSRTTFPLAPLPRGAVSNNQAVDYLQQAVAFDDKDGHTWEELAYCYLMINDLQNSYTAYQHALYHIQNPKVGLVEGRWL